MGEWWLLHLRLYAGVCVCEEEERGGWGESEGYGKVERWGERGKGERWGESKRQGQVEKG